MIKKSLTIILILGILLFSIINISALTTEQKKYDQNKDRKLTGGEWEKYVKEWKGSNSITLEDIFEGKVIKSTAAEIIKEAVNDKVITKSQLKTAEKEQIITSETKDYYIDLIESETFFSKTWISIKKTTKPIWEKPLKKTKEILGFPTGGTFIFDLANGFISCLIPLIIFSLLIKGGIIENNFIKGIAISDDKISFKKISRASLAFTIIYSTIMVIPVINRIIESILFTPFIFILGTFGEFAVRTVLLSFWLFIIFLIPSVYLKIVEIRQKAKAIKRIHQAASSGAAQQAYFGNFLGR